MNVLVSELIVPAEQFPMIAKECRKFASIAGGVLDRLIDDNPKEFAKWSIIDDMLCDMHDACDTIDA